MADTRNDFRLGIIGLTPAHTHVFAFLCDAASQRGMSVTCFTTAEKRTQAQTIFRGDPSVKWVLQSGEESRGAFLNRIERSHADDLDALVINTVFGPDELAHYYRFRPGCDLYCWIYSVNKWFAPSYELDVNLKRTVSVNLRHVLRRLLLRRLDGLFVEHQNMPSYIRSETSYSKPVYHLTPVIYEPEFLDAHRSNPSENLTFTVPGSIIHLRDYDLVLDAFEELFQEYEDVELCLLGPFDSNRSNAEFLSRVRDRCRELHGAGFDIQYYDRDWIPFEDYYAALAETDIVVSPTRRFEVVRENTSEIMGLTHGTGAVFDALRGGCPVVIPDQYVLSADTEPIATTYDATEPSSFRQQIRRFIEDEAFRTERMRSARRHARTFDLKRNQKRVRSIFTTGECRQ